MQHWISMHFQIVGLTWAYDVILFWLIVIVCGLQFLANMHILTPIVWAEKF